MKERNQYIDILKGIGALSIVMGHASGSITIGGLTLSVGKFVYLYHLAIFFFCSGYLYKKGTDFGTYVLKRLKTLYVPFLKYCLAYLIMRNIFIRMGIIDANCYSLDESIIAFTNILIFNGPGELLGAFWFLPVMFASMCMFAWALSLDQKRKFVKTENMCVGGGNL